MPEQVRRLFGAGTLLGLGESQLLGRFVDHDDQAAFEAIVARHGPMVLGVCRRRLRDPNDLDDAFQATFLVLVEKARTLRDREALGPWLHGVARRVASRARAAADLRPGPSRDVGPAGAPQGGGRDDLLAALDEEIERLPEAFRLPIVLCHLEGYSYEEAAARLRWSEGMVRGRLARGKARLRQRLIRRGLAPDAAGRPAGVAPPPPPSLLLSTMRLARDRAVPGAVPVAVTTLKEGALMSMGLMKSKAIVAGLLALGLVGSGALAPSARESPPRPSKAEPPRAPVAEAPPDLRIVREALGRWWGTIETLSFREENFGRDPVGRRDEGKSFLRLDFALAPADRFAYDLRGIRPDGTETLLLKKRWDGGRFYQFYPEGDGSREIRHVAESARGGPRDRYDGEMSDVLWLILPVGGKGPPAAAFGGGFRLEVERDPEGRFRVAFVDEKARENRGELDPDHGWMPKRVQLGAGNSWAVTRFSRDSGRWFPVEGTRTTSGASGKPITTSFVVADLRVNRPIPGSEFNREGFPAPPVRSVEE